MNRNEEMVKRRITNDLKDHVITVLHQDGLYRHWRCQKPGTWNMGFDVVTWPGSLCYTGDMGDFLFQRTSDMVEFMRRAVRDYSYCAQKCVAGQHEIKEWSEKLFMDNLAERIKEGKTFRVMRQGNYHEESVIDKVREIIHEYEIYESRHDAEKAMYESGLWDGGDMPSCEIYTMRFLWCLHALQWFCANVEHKQLEPIKAEG